MGFGPGGSPLKDAQIPEKDLLLLFEAPVAHFFHYWHIFYTIMFTFNYLILTVLPKC